MIIGLPRVIALNRFRSAGRCHGMSPALPMTPLRATAATMTTDGEAGIASLPALGFRPDLTTTGPRTRRAANGRPAPVLTTRDANAAALWCTPPAAQPIPAPPRPVAPDQSKQRRQGKGG